MKHLFRWLLMIAALSSIALVSVNRFAHSSGVDFYHYWAVANAVRAGDLRGLDFYASPEPLDSVARAIARDSGDRRLLTVNETREMMHLTGTPTQYWIFSVLPASYSSAFAMFAVLLTASLIGAMILLFRAYGSGVPLALSVAAVVVIAYPPFRWDFEVGNVNSFQLFALSCLAVWIKPRRRHRVAKVPVVIWILPILTALVFIKPSIVVPTAALGLVVVLGSRLRSSLIATGVSMVVAFAMAVIPLLYFGTRSLWIGWWGYVSGGRDEGLLFPTEWGNRSTVILLHERTGIGPTAAAAFALAVFLALAAVGVAFRSREATLVSRLTASLGEVLSDPFRAVTAGVLLTCATSIVYWPHYYLFCLWGGLAMVLGLRRRPTAAALALTGLVLSSDLLRPLFSRLDAPDLSLYAVAACWMLITPLVFLDGHDKRDRPDA